MNVACKEADVLRGALELLALRGFPRARINAGGWKVKGGYAKGAPAGWSDVIGWVPGSARFMACEIKAPGELGSLTAAQAAFLDSVIEAGGVGLVVDDLGRLDESLKALLDDPYAALDLYGRRVG